MTERRPRTVVVDVPCYVPTPDEQAAARAVFLERVREFEQAPPKERRRRIAAYMREWLELHRMVRRARAGL